MTEVSQPWNPTPEELLSEGVKRLDDALVCFMEVKSEIGVTLADKVYKAIRAYEKYQEKLLKAQEKD